MRVGCPAVARPRVGDRVHFHASPMVLRALDEHARDRGYTRSETIRRLLTAAISQPELVDRFLPPNKKRKR